MSGFMMLPYCPHCGVGHAGMCWQVKAIEYHPDGTIKRVEYHDPNPPLTNEGAQPLRELILNLTRGGRGE